MDYTHVYCRKLPQLLSTMQNQLVSEELIYRQPILNDWDEMPVIS
jgi:hypothetical protein